MALGAENVTALLMPSEYSSDRSVRDSLELCKMHGVAHRILPIGSAFGSIKETLLNQWGEAIRPLTEENIQPRLRALYLMAHSNQFGDMWLNSSNKSEAAVGYSTLYGDMGGGLSVVGDLYKTQLYALANYWNEQGSWIPASIVQALPSAELRPDQLDTDSLPPYPVLDALLMDLIEGGLDRAGLYQAGHDPDIVSRVWGLVRRSEFKRFQMPPVLRVSSRSFGRGWRQSLV
jgi:NAD+ synthase (glutamine-hydrolysing)